MSEIAERYRTVAGQFTQRVEAVPAGSWDNPAPCDGWVARDVVGHLVEWLPAFFFETWGIDPPPAPPVDADPVEAWKAVDGALRSALADPEIAGRERETRMGRSTFEQTLDLICTPDILIHTWDLSRATGLDETLDRDAVHRWIEAMDAMGSAGEQAMRESGQYGPRVEVPADADDQTRVLAFAGRRP